MSYTAGPWRVDEGCYAVRADALPMSAKTGMDSGVVCVAVHSPEDARLIAQAPRLLELVHKAEQMGAQQYGGGEDVPMRSAWMWLANQCKDAIEASTLARSQADRGATDGQ